MVAGTRSEAITGKLDELLQPWNRSDAPGLVIGVARGGAPIYRRGFGLASLEQGLANTPKTRMRIGSTSKQFTSLAALILADEGKLDLDAPVRQYIPELRGASGEPSLRQMMYHTSGLRDPYDIPGVLLHGGWWSLSGSGTGFEVAQRFTQTNYPAGERMIYCNQGYYLLSLAIERASAMPFGSFLKERVLAPLGMNDTELLHSDMLMLPRTASLHMPQSDGSYRRGIYFSEEQLGAGGLISTVDDLLEWLAHLRSESKIVGSPAAWEQLLRRPRYGSGKLGDYCLGLIRETYRGVEIVHHGGAVLGGQSQLLTVPAHQLDIAVLFNRMDGPAPHIALKVVDAVLANELAPPASPLESSDHEGLIGRWYSSTSHRMFTVVANPVADKAPVLTLSIHDQIAGLLRRTERGLIMTSSAHGAVELLIPTAGSRRDTLDISDSGHTERYIRLPDHAPSVTELAPQVLGRYRYVELGIDLSVILHEEALYLDLHPRTGYARFRLSPYSAEVCGCTLVSSLPVPVPTLGTLAIERSGGEVTGLWLNSWRTRNLWLERRP